MQCEKSILAVRGSPRTSTPTGTRKFQNFTKREDTILPYGGWGFIFAFDLSIVPFLRLVDCFFLSFDLSIDSSFRKNERSKPLAKLPLPHPYTKPPEGGR